MSLGIPDSFLQHFTDQYGFQDVCEMGLYSLWTNVIMTHSAWSLRAIGIMF